MDFTGLYYSKDIQFKDTSGFDQSAFNSGTLFYEVLRITDGTALFLEDHLQRLQDSITLSGSSYSVSVSLIHYLLRNLIRHNNTANGNVKIIVHFVENSSPVIYTFFIPHLYPVADMYELGVDTLLYKAVRSEPNIKKLHPDITQNISLFIKEKGIYDALLVDPQGYVTEGSKTNVFFIQGDIIYTAPADKVLKGITRMKTIKLCQEHNITLIEKNIPVTDLHQYDSVFFTGTSPKILPVRQIDTTKFGVDNKLMRKLMLEYDKLIWNYLNNN